MTESPILTRTQLRMARAALEMELRTLGELALINPAALADLERGERTMSPDDQAKLKAIFEDKGVKFLSDKNGNVGVMVRDRGPLSDNVVSLPTTSKRC